MAIDHPNNSTSADRRDDGPWSGQNVLGAAVVWIGLGLVAIVISGISIWTPGRVRANSAGSLGSWVAALALIIAVLGILARKGRHAGWFHPLSLPLATIAVMSLGAPLWVYFTHQPVGLLYDPGYLEPGASSLAAAVSVTACEALSLVVIGYIVGASATLVMTGHLVQTNSSRPWPLFRYREMRLAGLTLMTTGALAQLVVAGLTRGHAYGANQLQYGATSILGVAASTLLLAGLILATLKDDRSLQPVRMTELLKVREWAALLLYLLAVAVTGQRAGLIGPIVYIAWAYSTRVRVIPLKWIVVTILLALVGGAVISNYRANDGLSPGSPMAVARSAIASTSSSAWLAQQTVIHVPSDVNYMHGATYLAALEGQLPGPLSRTIGAPARTASAVFRNIIGYSDPNQGFAESYSSEAYLNFGLVGCLGAGLFLGALMGWAWRRSETIAASARNVLYPVLLAGLIGGFRSDALAQIKQVLYPMLLLALLMAWHRLRPQSVQMPVREG
jgi:hypothetical protein